MKLVTLAGVAAVALTACAANAEDAAKAPKEKRVERTVVLVERGGPGGPDADKDGVVTRDEFMARHAEMFDHLDKNKDGKLTPDEFGPRGGPRGGRERIEICRVQGPGDKEPRDVPCGGPDGPGGPGGPGPRHLMMLERGEGLDVNKDGKISFDELAAPMREHFQSLDTNKDGFLDAEEREAMHGPMVRRFELKRGDK